MTRIGLQIQTILVTVACTFAAAPAWAQQYTISIYAGGASPLLPAPATSVPIGYPQAVVGDGKGNVYFSSWGTYGVFKVNAAGTVSMLFGTAAYATTPGGLAMDPAGNLYFTDASNSVIRKVDANGVITVVPGTSSSSSPLMFPAGLAVDGAGSFYIVEEFFNHRLRKVDANGTSTILAGEGTTFGSQVNGKPATQALLSRPTGVAVDGAGNLFVNDANAGYYYVYKIDIHGIITVAAGNGGTNPTGEGVPATSVGVCAQWGLGADAAGNLYIPDTFTTSIRKVDTSGTITTVAGTGNLAGFGGDGGLATSASLTEPEDAAPDASGVLWIADTDAFRVRKVDTNKIITTVAGLSGSGYAGDGGPSIAAQLSNPTGVALDAAGNLLIADTGNVRIRNATWAGKMTTFAGSGIMGFLGDGGPALSSQLFNPAGVAVDHLNNVYIADQGEVHKVDTNGNIGSAYELTAIGHTPAIAVDAAGNLYLDDSNLIRKVAVGGTVTTVAGNGTSGYTGDGGQATKAELTNPLGLVVDSAGDLYISDATHIRKVDATGIITTVATLPHPLGLAIDTAGELVVADYTDIRKIDKNGIVTTIASGLNGATGIAAGANGLLFVAESANNVVRELVPQLPDLTIAATHSANFSQGQTGAVYSITVRNAGSSATTAGVTVADMLPGALTATAISGTGWTCTLATLTCTRADALAGGASYPAIALTVTVAANAPASVTNVATVSGGGESNTNNDTASDPTSITQFPDLTVSATHSGTFKQGQAGGVYAITVSNAGSGATNAAVTVADTLPGALTATAISGTGWTCTLSTLTCTRGDALAAGASYPAIAIAVTVAANAPASVTNIATVSGGGETNTANDTASDPTSIGQFSDLTVSSTHSGIFRPGQSGAVYTIAVSNIGNAATNAAVTVIDTLPGAFAATAMSGTGWTCTLGTLTCTRGDTLAAGTSYPAIALTVNVAADTTAASVVNIATVSGGGESNTTNDTASDPTSIAQSPDLTVAPTHSGNFTQGQAGGVFTITVRNAGNGATNAAVTVADTPPDSMTATAMSGTGWTCSLVTFTCTRADALAAGASYPPVTLLVSVAANAPATVFNIATVSGGGESNTANDTVGDLTSIAQLPDLAVAATHSGNFTQGQAGAVYTIIVRNAGGGATNGAVTVADTLPARLTATAMGGAGWTCTLATLTCTRGDALAGGANYPPIALTVNVTANAPASVTNTATVIGGGQSNTTNDTASDPTSIGVPADLTVTAAHSGNFTQGQTGAIYTITVGNAGAGATNAAVTVVDTLPAKLTATALGGTGWTCTLAALTCTRGDALAAGARYPSIALTVTIAADAPATVTNTATVSGGAESNTANDAASDVTTIVPVLACIDSLSPDGATFPAAGGSGTVTVTAGAGCVWTTVGTRAWVTLTSPATGSGSGTLGFTLDPNSGSPRAATLSIAGLPFTVQQDGAPAGGLSFVPLPPCRVADTRGGQGIDGGTSRSFDILQSACNVAATARAYSLNVTVVPRGPLHYLTLWPSGQSQPAVSTLNSWDGTVVANAAIVPAGVNGEVSVFASDATDVVLDIDGYFDTSTGSGSFDFYPAVPCRVADTRFGSGPFGGPSMTSSEPRDFAIPLSSCNIPSTASGYSLNVTVVPPGYLGYLTTWPTGQTKPDASTLNSWTGKVVANAAIVPAGSGESISVYVSNPTDVILDINGYFGAPGAAGALRFYPVTPCRIADTRRAEGPFGGPEMQAATARSFAVPASACNIPSTAAAYSLNVTVVPDGVLSYLTAWPAGAARPLVSTLNSFDGSVVANAAIVPAGTEGAVSIYATNPTHVILDINGYFAP